MKKIWVFLLWGFLFPVSVYGLSMECPNVASAGEEIHCVVLEKERIGIKANYQINPVFTYLKLENSSSWKDYYHDSLGFSVGNVLDDTPFEGTITFRVGNQAVSGEEYEIALIDIEGVDTNYQSQELESIRSTIKIVSDINTLEKIEVQDGVITPEFDKNVTSYQVVVDKNSTKISAVLTDKNAKIKGDIGEVILEYGMNVFKIQVTSTRGSLREYQIYITRPFPKAFVSLSSDVTLKNLTISDGKLDFKTDVYLYHVLVENKVETIEINAVPNHSQANVEIQKPEQLVVGDNEVKVIVTAEDGTKIIYVIMIHREKKLSSDNQLKNLKIKGYSILFDSNVYQYDLEIQGESKLEIEVILSDIHASYKIKGNKNLKDGSIITIEVQAEDGSIQNYFIHVLNYHEDLTSSIFYSIKIIPLILFILFISVILMIKILKKREK